MRSLLLIPLLAAAIVPVEGRPKDGGLTIWPAPPGEKLYGDYTVRLNGKEAPVYACRVSAMPFNQVWPGYQRPLDQSELAGFATWGMAGAVEVEVRVTRPFREVAVRPSSRGIRPVVKGRTIRFTLPRPGQYTVELDGPHHALHLFANPPETDAPKAGGANVLYFGPGVHRPGKIVVKSGQTVYIAGGAVVYTAINGKGVSGVRVLGRGIVDTSEFEREQGPGSIRFDDSSDIKVEGVILRDPDLWCLSVFGSRGVEISNIKMIGLWRYNSDGIDICNTQEVTIRDSFVRSFDDSIVLKGMGGGGELWGQPYTKLPVRNVRVSGLVVWCDWGRALELGAETAAPEISGVEFRDIDIIRTCNIAMDIQHGDRAAVHGIRFENIRVEVDEFNPRPTIQRTREEKYDPKARPGYVPVLMTIIIRKGAWSTDQERGTARDVVFKDISVTGKPVPPSSFTGCDAGHDVRGVSIENLRFNGRPVRNAEEARLKIGAFVTDVRFVPAAGR
jgi:hypothetical protein